MTPKKYGYDSYCSFFGEHKSNPCPCGWSTKKDYSEFAEDIVHYVAIYKKEKGIDYDPSIGEFLAWVLCVAWD